MVQWSVLISKRFVRADVENDLKKSLSFPCLDGDRNATVYERYILCYMETANVFHMSNHSRDTRLQCTNPTDAAYH